MKKKNIVVTGGSGYIGTEIVYSLVKKNYKVVVLDKRKPERILPGSTFFQHNLLSKKGLSEIFNECQSCIHLAAEVGGVSYANKYPAKILTNNAIIDINAIEAAKAANLERFVYISSSLVYEKNKRFPHAEERSDMIAPPSLSYGFEKLLGENLCYAYFQEYCLQYSICRLFNVYGKNSVGNMDPNGHVIPDLIEKVRNSGGKIEIWGRKGIARNFTHVTDVAQGIIATLESDKGINNIFNISSDKEFTLEQIVRMLWKILGKKGSLSFSYLANSNKDVKRNLASVEKARTYLKWGASKKIVDGLSEMV